jgi:SNF2 family DNA or RNA helicase
MLFTSFLSTYIDPWWNGAVEQQCIDRIHRIGQQAKEVRVRRFCVANSIEERILELQERKKNIASAALRDNGESSQAGSSAARPSLDDFKLLFEEVKNDMKK